MKKNLLSVLSVFILTSISAQEFEKNQLIIKVKDGLFKNSLSNLKENRTGIPALDSLNKNFKVKEISPIGNPAVTSSFLIKFNNDTDVVSAAGIYTASEKIDFAEPNYIAHGAGVKGLENVLNIPNDTFFATRQWGLLNNGSFSQTGMTTTVDADVDMEMAWDLETGSPNMIIAVADSGLNMQHEDIQGRIWIKTSEIIDGIDNDGNGLIDDNMGWDYVNNDNNPTDDHGHGTNCAGIIGSVANNSKGYTGVNWNSKIMPLKVLNSSNSGNYANMANSLYYAGANGAKIVSMSIGGTAPSALLANAISYLKTNNVLLVACMMNNNNEIANYPAAYSTLYDNVIAVGSTDANDKRTQPFFWGAMSGSSYGNHINVVAPGNYIYGLGVDSNFSYGSYWGGTSQATPLVAGVASLMMSKNPSLTPAQVRSILQSTAEDMKGLPLEDTVGFDKYHGYGRINAFNALNSPLFLNTNEIIKNSGLQIINPVLDKNLILFVNESGIKKVDVQILTFDGRQVYRNEIQLQQGRNSVSVSSLPVGNYILTADAGTFKKIFKISVR